MVTDWGPLITVVLPAVGALLIYGAARWRLALGEALAVLVAALTVTSCALTVTPVFSGQVLTWGGGGFWALRVDALSGILLAVIAVVTFLAVVYSVPAMRETTADKPGQRQRLPLYYALISLFEATMLWACTTDNIVVLYLAVEATTLASALLITFRWDRRALEAGYKYLLLLTVGLTFALFGCVLLYAASAGLPGMAEMHFQAMLLSVLGQNAPALVAASPSVVLLAIAFLFIGFGTKTGLIPFHAWLPDAQSEAPSPVAALLSGVLEIAGAYALARTLLPFFCCLPGLPTLLMVAGGVTMFLGIALVAAQTDLKRLLAYSSISQLGYVVLGFGIGTPLGIFGGLFHLINHALAKSLLFLGAGAVEMRTGTRDLRRLGGLQRWMPWTAACFFIGVLALGGMPPLNGFLSKLTIFVAAASAGIWWAVGVAVITGLCTLVVMVRAGIRVFMGPNGEAVQQQPREVGRVMILSMAVLALACLLLGILPGLVGPALDQASVAALPSMAAPFGIAHLPGG